MHYHETLRKPLCNGMLYGQHREERSMDDREFWGIDPPDDGQMSLRDEWEGSEDIAGQLMAEEHLTQDVPAQSAVLHRGGPDGFRDTMQINGYPRVRNIFVTCPPGNGLPGFLGNMPVGWRDLSTPETFRRKFERAVASYEKQGWVREDDAAKVGDS
jgi:hypothetical protein